MLQDGKIGWHNAIEYRDPVKGWKVKEREKGGKIERKYLLGDGEERGSTYLEMERRKEVPT